MTGGFVVTLRNVTSCASPVCACRARAHMNVRGFGSTTGAYYESVSSIRVTAGRTSGGPRGVLHPLDFERPELQRKIVAAFLAKIPMQRQAVA